MGIEFAGLENIQDVLIASGILLSFGLTALLFYKKLYLPVFRIIPGIPSDPESLVTSGLRLPITLMIIGVGAFLAVNLPLDLSGRPVALGISLTGMILGIVGVSSVLASIVTWFLDGLITSNRTAARVRMFPIVRRMFLLFLYILGGLLILDSFDINITPLIAGLGIGGVAVALALQPTLANLFAGTYVMSEGVINPDDFVELENGLSGYVVDVGWRSTRIRSIYNNLVVIPNARFSELIITDYHQPEEPMNFRINCGVSFDSNLRQVERVCREVMDEVMEADPNGVPEATRRFGFEEFGESNVNFFLFVQAKDRISRIPLRTELMERLSERFQEEGIVINYPIRSLRLPDSIGPLLQPRKESDFPATAPKNGGGLIPPFKTSDLDSTDGEIMENEPP